MYWPGREVGSGHGAVAIFLRFSSYYTVHLSSIGKKPEFYNNVDVSTVRFASGTPLTPSAVQSSSASAGAPWFDFLLPFAATSLGHHGSHCLLTLFSLHNLIYYCFTRVALWRSLSSAYLTERVVL